MKSSRRLLSVLLSLVLCVGLFSVTAHAEEVDTQYWFQHRTVVYNNSPSGSVLYDNSFVFDNYNNELEQNVDVIDFNSNLFTRSTYTVIPLGSKPFLQSTNQAVVSVFNLYHSFLSWSGEENYFNYNNQNDLMVTFLVYYADNSNEYIPGVNLGTVSGGNRGELSVKLEFVPKNDVTAIEIIVDQYHPYSSKYDSFNVYQGEFRLGGYGVSIEQGSNEEEELKKANGFLGGILDGITNLFNSIIELPQKLWNLIADGLKGLFVPSQESMIAYSDKWDELLASRFGAVYQVVHIITDSWEGVMNAQATNTITLPVASIDLVGTTYSFGGYEVQIVPDGFDVLVTALKSIIGIVATALFVNGLRKRYDEVMGVNQ